jgi:plastocyanin
MRGPMPRLRAPIGALAALLLALGATACGHRPTTVVHGQTLRLRMEEFRFVPQKIRARPGPLTIQAYNAGKLPHNVVVFRKTFEVARATTVQHGQTATVRLRLKRGDYRLECTIQNHDDLGMYAALLVR